jgi:pimeloyl-ACP methyl ester carboxylesterase
VTVWELDALSVPVGDGRLLEVVLAGPPDGMPLFSHHGTPGAAEMFDPLVEIGAERGLRHITYSRPGYGGSGRQPGRTVADCIADVAAVADALEYDRFYSVGASGGGPHSIACAVLLPERVIAAASIASPAPIEADGFDWAAGMGEENLAELAASQSTDDEFEAYLDREAQLISGTSVEEIVKALGDTLSEVDRQALTGALGEFIVRETSHALAGGIWGWFDDDRAIFGNWGFELSEQHAPLAIWHGGQDRFVPIEHGEWLAASLGADAYLRPNNGHMSISLGGYGELLDRLLEH